MSMRCFLDGTELVEGKKVGADVLKVLECPSCKAKFTLIGGRGAGGTKR